MNSAEFFGNSEEKDEISVSGSGREFLEKRILEIENSFGERSLEEYLDLLTKLRPICLKEGRTEEATENLLKKQRAIVFPDNFSAVQSESRNAVLNLIEIS